MSLEREISWSLSDPRHDDRVRRHTAGGVNDRIDRKTRECVQELALGDREEIVDRIRKLDREWDVDRALMANFALLGGYAFLQSRRHKKQSGWTQLFASQLGFLLMHAVAGWCPPLPVFRRLGFRTAKEISAERMMLLQKLDESGAGPMSDREAESFREE